MSKRSFPEKVFLAVAGIITLISLVATCAGWASLDSIVFKSGTEPFGDFMAHMLYASDLQTAYQQSIDAVFMPFAYLMYWIFARLVHFVYPGTVTHYYDWRDNDYATSVPYATMVYALYLAILMVCFFALLLVITRKKPGQALLLAVVIVLSGSFFEGYIERANAAFLVMLLIGTALVLRQSQNKVHREIALLLFGCAIGFKLYPLIFFLLYVKEHRWGEAVRFVVYGLAFLLLPFFVVGWEYLPIIADHIQTVTYINGSIRTIPSAFAFVGELAGCEWIMTKIGGYVALAFAVLAAVASFRTTSTWKTYYLLIAIMFLVPDRSGYYCLSYLIVPLLFWIRELDEDMAATGSTRAPKNNVVVAVLFGCTFCLMTIWPLCLEYVLNYAPMYVLTIMVLWQTLISKKEYIPLKQVAISFFKPQSSQPKN